MPFSRCTILSKMEHTPASVHLNKRTKKMKINGSFLHFEKRLTIDQDDVHTWCTHHVRFDVRVRPAQQQQQLLPFPSVTLKQQAYKQHTHVKERTCNWYYIPTDSSEFRITQCQGVSGLDCQGVGESLQITSTSTYIIFSAISITDTNSLIHPPGEGTPPEILATWGPYDSICYQLPAYTSRRV